MNLSQGPLVKFIDGTLVRTQTNADTYFIISDGLKRRFTDQAQLETLGYRPENVITGLLVNYTEGSVVE